MVSESSILAGKLLFVERENENGHPMGGGKRCPKPELVVLDRLAADPVG
jgi:hypothetical protein